MNILLIILLIIMTGFFAIAEASILYSKKSRLQALAKKGSQRAKLVLKLSLEPHKIIATSQIGLTLLAILEGAITSQTFEPIFNPIFKVIPYVGIYATEITLVISFLLVTGGTILFGDVISKRIALTYPEKTAIIISPLVLLTIQLFTPFIFIFSYLSNKVLKALSIPTELHDKVSAEDIETIFEEGAQSGLLDATEKNLLNNVWRMDERRVGSIMTPRSDIVYIDVQSSYLSNLDVILNNPSKYIVVCDGGLDKPLGFGRTALWLKDVVRQMSVCNAEIVINWKNELKPIHAMPDSLSLIDTLESFRKHKTSIALVYDEFGLVEGIITMSDLMGAVVGDSTEMSQENLLIIKDEDGTWLVDGLASLDDLQDALKIYSLKDDNNTYHTAGGFILNYIGKYKGRLPKEFDKFLYAGHTFEVVDIDRTRGYRIDRIMVKKIKKEKNES